MINRSILIALLATSMSLSGFAQDSTTASFQKMKWLLGHWEGEWNGAPFYEKWRVIDSTHLHHVNYDLNNGDTVVKSESVIMIMGNNIRYEGSNGYVFSLVSVDDSSMVFANPDHGEKLTFRLLADGRWLAEIITPQTRLTHYLRRKTAK
jgi:hypothetical protein